MIPLHTSVRRNPKRRSTRGAMLFIMSEPMAVATVIMPLRAAVKPKPTCIISGSRKGWALGDPGDRCDHRKAKRAIAHQGKVEDRASRPCAWRM
jgi:hypothetical protein